MESEIKKVSDIEKEIFALRAINEMINDMVNHSIMTVYDGSNMAFKSHTHQLYFSVLLVDFLSEPKSPLFGIDQKYLITLKKISENPSFNIGNSIDHLSQAVQGFSNWLEAGTVIEKMWFPSIDLEINLKLKRIQCAEICGNISKHNFTRLTFTAEKMRKIFRDNGKNLDQTDCLLALEDFYEWFHGDGGGFVFYGNVGAEFLNNIRWGIYEYLQPEFRRAFTFSEKNGLPHCECDWPQNVNGDFVKRCYWDLMMMAVHSRPYFPKFKLMDAWKKY